jgi:hypothetical protein
MLDAGRWGRGEEQVKDPTSQVVDLPEGPGSGMFLNWEGGVHPARGKVKKILADKYVR